MFPRTDPDPALKYSHKSTVTKWITELRALLSCHSIA